MNYRLAVLTHGRMDTFAAAIESFAQHVSPAPTEFRVYGDGVKSASIRSWLARHDLSTLAPGYPLAEMRSPAQLGFCRATGALWEWARDGEIPYVFWLEHDFVFLRDVDLRELAKVLESDHRLAQMALVRGAANPQEAKAGGLIESRPGEFRQRETCISDPSDTSPQPGFWEAPWLEHRSFFTTNPSLMRRGFMEENPWPTDGRPQCEGHFGIKLVESGYSFGFWGSGEPWVDHIGVRNGIGY